MKTKQLGIRLQTKLIKEYEKLAKERMITKEEIIRKILSDYIINKGKEK